LHQKKHIAFTHQVKTKHGYNRGTKRDRGGEDPLGRAPTYHYDWG